jgi:hypothetical protein
MINPLNINKTDIGKYKEQRRIKHAAGKEMQNILAKAEVKDPEVALVLWWWDHLGYINPEIRIRSLANILPLKEEDIRYIINTFELE